MMAMCLRDKRLEERVSCWTTESEIKSSREPCHAAGRMAGLKKKDVKLFSSATRPAKAGTCEVGETKLRERHFIKMCPNERV